MLLRLFAAVLFLQAAVFGAIDQTFVRAEQVKARTNNQAAVRSGSVVVEDILYWASTNFVSKAENTNYVVLTEQVLDLSDALSVDTNNLAALSNRVNYLYTTLPYGDKLAWFMVWDATSAAFSSCPNGAYTPLINYTNHLCAYTNTLFASVNNAAGTATAATNGLYQIEVTYWGQNTNAVLNTSSAVSLNSSATPGVYYHVAMETTAVGGYFRITSTQVVLANKGDVLSLYVYPFLGFGGARPVNVTFMGRLISIR